MRWTGVALAAVTLLTATWGVAEAESRKLALKTRHILLIGTRRRLVKG